jgi:hypothetical protein
MNASQPPRFRSSGARLGLVAVLVVAGAVGCSRTHLTSTHGRAYREAFAAQDANPNRGPSKSVHGLDSQEAKIIAGGYRKALAPKADSSDTSSQLLMIGPRRGVDNTPLPASVPGGN